MQGEFARVDPAQLRAVVLPHAKRGFFAVRLDDAKHAVERLPWVESARVRKQWPDVLEVSIVEHKPFARWGNDRLLSEQGKLFPTPKKLADLQLPQLDGPDSQTEEVVKLYNDSRALFAPAGVDVRRLTMDARGSWSLLLSNGTEVVVGRDDARSRLQRFVRVLPQLANQSTPIERADLRYTNGFTLSWGTPAAPANAPGTPARRTQERT